MVDKEKIQKEAWEILQKFSNALDKIKIEKIDFFIEREEFEREEGEGIEGNEEFKERILKNAPKSSADSIIVEKGKWK